MSPSTPENTEINILNKWYSLIFCDIFLAEAAGRISSALIIKIPTHLIVSITMSAISTANKFSIT
jgi:hypothetical protein